MSPKSNIEDMKDTTLPKKMSGALSNSGDLGDLLEQDHPLKANHYRQILEIW